MTVFWEDLTIGDSRSGGAFEFDKAGIVEFASRFDPRPTHLDEAAATDSLFDGLVASGAHTFAAWSRLYLDLTPDYATQAGVEIRQMRMIRAVRPGDRLSLSIRITGKRDYPMRPGYGLLDSYHELLNQDGRRVTTLDLVCLIERRPPADRAGL